MNYKEYKPSEDELFAYYSASCAVLFALGMLFYRSVIFSGALCILSIPLKKYYAALCIRKRNDELTDEFRSFLYSISASVAAGYQLPTAFSQARDLLFSEKGEKSLFGAELSAMLESYSSAHEGLTDSFADFGRRSGLDAVSQFASALAVCRRNGGDMEAAASRSSRMMLERMDFQREADTAAAEKKYDLLILSSMPVLVLFFLNLSSPEYISLLYKTAYGRLIMTVSLLMIAGAVLWSIKILDIQV